MLQLSEYFDIYFDGDSIALNIPDCIVSNLHPSKPLRKYQQKAIAYFLHMVNDKRPRPRPRPRPTQLLFHMATGSGKTLIMAALILYLYKEGYRNFLFFVNSSNIINKTKDNFLNTLSSKYLFSEKIKLNDKEVKIREVNNFDEAVDTDINIHFTTIQGLHSRLNTPSENAITYEDFEEKDVVLISDEAHHINTLTKKTLSKNEAEEENSWERTVQTIFRSSSNNFLLEFTATVELDNPAIKKKYEDKTLYEYFLKQFRQDKYSKEVDVLQADLPDLDRAFQAVILSQYRRKVAEKNGLHIKPVILMKSKTIKDSEKIEEKFYTFIETLQSSEINKIQERSSGVIKKAFDYFLNKKKITPTNLIKEIQEDFSREKCISVNSQSDSEEKQLKVNSLENHDNEIRVVFAVDKLNEGWDILNLYDIVRLYNTRDNKGNKLGKTTISEAQLIGRGARYCPFNDPQNDELPKDRRKYDENPENELKILEELYYHCFHSPKYIREIKMALKDVGIMAEKTKSVTLKVKDHFKGTNFYQEGSFFINKRIKNKREGVLGFNDYAIDGVFKYPHLMTGKITEGKMFEDGYEFEKGENTISKILHLKSFKKGIIQRAIDSLEFFKFETLKKYFPKLKAVKYLIERDEFLASTKVEVRGLSSQIENLSSQDKLDIVIHVLRQIESCIKNSSYDYEGTKEFKPVYIKDLVKDKKFKISIDVNSDQEYGRSWKNSKIKDLEHINLLETKWFIYDENYGTSEEKHFIKYINDNACYIDKKYDDFYLIRNEKTFKIYSFKKGDAFEPDFILLLKPREKNQFAVYQLFIEAKGKHLLEKDQWKEDFLLEIEKDHKAASIAVQNKEYRLIGLPFYNEEVTKNTKFTKSFQTALKLDES